MRLQPGIRFRLTAWYIVALAAGLSLFAAVIWFSMSASLSASLNATLADRGRSVAAFYEHELRSDKPSHMNGELNEFSQGLPLGVSVEILDGRGSRIFASPAPAGSERRTRTEKLTLNGERYEIRAAGSLEPIRETLGRLRMLLFACTPMVILIASFGGYWLSRRALLPVTAITNAAQTIGIENLSHRLEVPRTGDELQRLSETWNALLARLETAVNRLSQFTADASHELRTPLAVIRATAELAARKSRSPESYRAALVEVVTETDRMTQLVDDLLFLARYDAGASQTPDSLLDLAPIVRDVCASVEPLASSKQVALFSSLSPTPVLGNAAALRRLMLVLIDNAIKYSPAGGQVGITLRDCRLTVRDSGMGIPADALPHIFERFYQADPSRSNSGYGLGLAQAQSIARRHGASIAARSRPGEGATFEVLFASAPGAAPSHEQRGLAASAPT